MGIKNVVSSYAIKKISRSVQNTNFRMIRLEAKLNQDKLAQLYYKVIKGDSQSDFAALLLKSQFSLDGFNYSDIGIENRADFIDAIDRSWLGWFKDNKSNNIQSVQLTTEDTFSEPKNSILVNISIELKLKDYKEEGRF